MICLFSGQRKCRNRMSSAETDSCHQSIKFRFYKNCMNSDRFPSRSFLPFVVVNSQLLPPSLPSLKQCSSQSSSPSLLVFSQLSTRTLTQKLTLLVLLVVSRPTLPSDAVGRVRSTFKTRAYLINFTLSGPEQQALQHPWRM